MKMEKIKIIFIKMNNIHHQLISLFQQNSNATGNNSGYRYKLLTGTNLEIDVPFNSFTSFIDGLLSHIFNSNNKYIEDKEISLVNDTTIDPSEYGSIVVEKIDKMMTPIAIDIVMEFNDINAVSFYHDKFIYQCIFFLQDIILGTFNVPPSNGEFNKILLCFVTESDPIVRDGKQIIKIRFQFPYTKVNLDHLNKVIIRLFKSTIVEKNLIKDYVHQTPTNSIDKMIPPATEYLSMYGCKASHDDSPLILRNVYSYIADVNILDKDYEDENVLPFVMNYLITTEQYNFYEKNKNNQTCYTHPDFIKLKDNIEINPLNHSLIISKYISYDFFDPTDRLYNLPLILSVHFCSDILNLCQDVDINPSLFIEEPKPIFNEGSSINNNRLDKYQMLAQLLPMIGKNRFLKAYKHDWITVGKAIHTIYHGRPEGLAIFDYYTPELELKKDCEDYYNNFNSEMLDIRTIRHYASIDSPAIYNEWNKQLYHTKIMNALSLQELDFIEFAIHILCLKFVYDRNGKIWYYFNGVRLVADPGASVLIDHLKPINDNPGNDMIMKAIYAFQDEQIALSRNEKTRIAKATFDGIEKQVSALIRNMSTLRFLNKVVSALQIYMYDDFIYSKSDENPNLIACNNCVLECIDNGIIYREGRLQDYITKSTKIDFPTTYSIKHPKVQFMLKYYGQVHTDKELCHFFLKTLGSLMKGGNNEKFFINWIGEANASKSQVLKFLKAALGDYCVSAFPNHAITLNINANSGKPEPGIERAKGARVAVAAETDRSEKWHVGHIKKFTSGDDYDNRGLHEKGGERSASFQLIAMSNIDLDAPNADEAYYLRYVKIPFNSKWVDNAPATEEEQYAQRRFPIDLTFSTKISSHAQAQLFLMYYYYSIYKQEGIRILPEIVKTVTMKHQLNIDVITNFVKDRLKTFFIGDPKDKIPDRSHFSSVFDLHRMYKSWYSSAYGREVIPLDQFKFRDELSRRIGEPDSEGFWYGIEAKPMNNHNSSGMSGSL
jgi:phage/plasmid-associated DNA primase